MLTAVTRDPSTLSLGLPLLLRLLPPLSLLKLPEPDALLPGCATDAAVTAACRERHAFSTDRVCICQLGMVNACAAFVLEPVV